MNLNQLQYTEGSRKVKTRRCRGIGSGLGKNGGSGVKGQNSRSGGGVALGFEGGQNPLWRRLPKRGFKALKDNSYAVVNLDTLNNFKEGEEVNITKLIEKGLVKKEYNGLKVLAKGELKVEKLIVKANKFSKKASEVITSKGGSAEVI